MTIPLSVIGVAGVDAGISSGDVDQLAHHQKSDL